MMYMRFCLNFASCSDCKHGRLQECFQREQIKKYFREKNLKLMARELTKMLKTKLELIKVLIFQNVLSF